MKYHYSVHLIKEGAHAPYPYLVIGNEERSAIDYANSFRDNSRDVKEFAFSNTKYAMSRTYWVVCRRVILEGDPAWGEYSL